MTKKKLTICVRVALRASQYREQYHKRQIEIEEKKQYRLLV